jgi:hypothetical protein
MSDYKKLLNALTLTNIKALVRTYISHVKIVMSKKSKDELIEHIMKHTELVDGKVKTKPISFDMVKNKEKVVKEKKEKPKKDDEKPKKVVKEKKEKKEEEKKEKMKEFDETFALKRAQPKMTKEEYAEQAKQDELRKRADPLAVMFSDKLIKNVDKFKDFKLGNKNDDFLVSYVVSLIEMGDDFYHTYDKKESDDVRKVVDMMMKHLEAKDVAKQVVKKVMNDGRQVKMSDKQKEMYNDYLIYFSVNDLEKEKSKILVFNSPEVVKEYFQDNIDFINKLIPIKEKIEKSENERIKKSGEPDYVRDGEALGRLEDKLSKLSDKQLNDMLDDLNRLIRNSPYEMYPNEKRILLMIKQELYNRDTDGRLSSR